MMEDNAVAPVSAVIPCYRCAATIGRAVASIAQQTRKPAEVILVDDASGDGTLEILHGMAQQHAGWIKVIALNKNQGAASSRNAGWEAASQPYIAFLDSDDAWHPRKIEIQYAYMSAHPEVMLCGHGHRVVRQADRMPDWELAGWELGEWEAERIHKRALLLSNKFAPTSAMLRREVDQRFVNGRRYMEDHMLWLELVCGGCVVTKLKAELSAVYKNPFGVAGLSAHLWPMEKGELSNYARLHGSGYINLAEWLGLGLYSLLKYVRRLLIYWLHLRWKI
jgi:glycosyltransferase involved in cell wall biosynthesis